MEKDIKKILNKFKEDENNSNVYKTLVAHKKDTSIEESRTIKKNIFLSLPKVNPNKTKVNNNFLKPLLNLTTQNKRNKTIDIYYPENTIQYEGHTIQKLKNNFKGFRKIKNRFVFKKPNLNKIFIDFNSCYKETPTRIGKDIGNIALIKKNKNKSLRQRIIKDNDITFFEKKLSIDYLSPIIKNMQILNLREEPNIKNLNVGDIMNKVVIKKKYKCLLSDNANDKCSEEKGGGLNIRTYFKEGNKLSTIEASKNVDRLDFYPRIKKSNVFVKDAKENNIKKKIIPKRNYNEVLEYYKKNRFSNCKKLIKETLLEARKEKNTIVKFFEKYRKRLDEFDDWNEPNNKDNLYDK